MCLYIYTCDAYLASNHGRVALGRKVEVRALDLALLDALGEPVADPRLGRLPVVERHRVHFSRVDEIHAQLDRLVELCKRLLRLVVEAAWGGGVLRRGPAYDGWRTPCHHSQCARAC